MSRSKKVTLGFVVMNQTTGQRVTEIFRTRLPAKKIALAHNQVVSEAIAAASTVAGKQEAALGEWYGVRKLEEHVPAEWVRGKDFEVENGQIVKPFNPNVVEVD